MFSTDFSSQMKIKLILLFVIFKFFSSTVDALHFRITSPHKKVSIDDALFSLEDIVREEGAIGDFCYTYFFQDNHEIFLATVNASDCSELYKAGIRSSGIYTIYLKNAAPADAKLQVFCDMTTAGGGWTVFQRRGEFPNTIPRVNFVRSWEEYEEGFGNLQEEFWLGNKYIHLLSTQNAVELRVELEEFNRNFTYAEYSTFKVDGADKAYLLTIGNYSGNAGDSMDYHNGMRFATYDNDYNSCAVKSKSGWWFNDCREANLNGEYLKGKHPPNRSGILWVKGRGKRYSYKWTEMKMRPKNFYSI